MHTVNPPHVPIGRHSGGPARRPPRAAEVLGHPATIGVLLAIAFVLAVVIVIVSLFDDGSPTAQTIATAPTGGAEAPAAVEPEPQPVVPLADTDEDGDEPATVEQPAAAPTPTPQSTPTPSPDAPGETAAPDVSIHDGTPTVVRFISGPANARSGPGLDADIIGSWQGTERAILTTGRTATVDGADWTQLAASGGGPVVWVASELVEPDRQFLSLDCFAGDDTVVAFKTKPDGLTFRGGVRFEDETRTKYFAIAGRFVGDDVHYDVAVTNVRSERTGEFRWIIEADTGAVAVIGAELAVERADCIDHHGAVSSILTTVTEHPAPPAATS